MRVVEAPIVRQPAKAAGPPRVALRAWDLITPLGDGIDAVWNSILGGAFLTDHARCGPSAANLARRVAGRVATGRVARDAAVVVGTSKGSVAGWLDPAGDVARRSLGLADIAVAVAETCGLGGPRLTVSAACASGLHALIRGAMMIRSGEARQVLVVAAEASVHPLFVGSFQRLGVLASAGAGCRPFDRRRDGFIMTDAAAAVLLEATDTDAAEAPSDAAAVYLDRFALAGDATHLTGGAGDARTLRHVLSCVIDGRPVDLVHAHGTGTRLNDEAELRAIEAALVARPNRPALYSHKGALGHSLGAAGLVSVVLNCQSHATGVVPPNVRTHDPLPASRVILTRHAIDRSIRRSIAIAAGFGGAVAAVSLVGGE